MHINDLNIAVIGGGIAGLTASIAFAKRGAQVTLFEQAAQISEVGAGIQISQNAIRVLQALGMKPEAQQGTFRPLAVELRDFRSGRLSAAMPMNRRADQPYLLFHRADLIEMLFAAAKRADVQFEFGKPMTVSRDDGVVYLQQGRQRDPRHWDLVIGADGVRSHVRKRLLGGGRPDFTGQVAWRGLVPAKDFPEISGQTVQRVYVGPGKHVVVYPLRDQSLVNVVAIAERKKWTVEGWHFHDDPQHMQDAFMGWCPPVTKLLSRIDDPILWGLFSHGPLKRWSVDNAVVLGDAAHPMLPFAAQGAAMGIEDAWVLADCVEHSTDLPQAMEKYEEMRKPRTTAVQRAAVANGRIFHINNPVLRGISHVGIRSINRLAPGYFTRRYDWIYSHDVTADSGQAASSTQIGT